MTTATLTHSTFQSTIAMPELFSSTRPASAKANRVKENLLDITESIIFGVIGNSCSVAPIVKWRDLAEPHIGFPEFHQLYTLFRETENLTVLSENDLPLPEYCSRAAAAFEHYSTLDDDWDSEGAEAPSDVALRDANFFLDTLGSQIIEAPEARPMLDCDGVPGIFWSTKSKYLSISFYEGFTLTYHYRDEESGLIEGDTIPLDDAPGISKILEYIEEL